jgi:large subunit ribosomal protein L24
MKKFHIKAHDEVVVTAGAESGKRGKVLRIFPTKERAIVEGLNMIKKHVKKNQQHPEGAIVEKEGTIHISNLMRVENFDARAAKRSGAAAPVEQ